VEDCNRDGPLCRNHWGRGQSPPRDPWSYIITSSCIRWYIVSAGRLVEMSAIYCLGLCWRMGFYFMYIGSTEIWQENNKKWPACSLKMTTDLGEIKKDMYLPEQFCVWYKCSSYQFIMYGRKCIGLGDGKIVIWQYSKEIK